MANNLFPFSDNDGIIGAYETAVWLDDTEAMESDND